MSPTPPPPPADTPAARLLEGLEGLDLTSADGRAGIRALLAEIERLSPGAILQQAARIDLRRAGCGAEESLSRDGMERLACPAPALYPMITFGG